MAWIRWRDWPLSQQMLVLAAMVAVAVGSLGAGVLGWQGLVSARAQVAREADQSLALVDSTLHLAYQSAVARGRLAIPAVYKAYGGEPRLAEAVATPTGADAAAPTLMAGGEAMNNRLVPLELLRDYTGAETAVLARNGQGRWIALASLRKHDDGSPRLGVPYAADDPVVRVAEAGQPADLLVQRAGRWNVMSIQPLRDPAGRVYGAISARVDVDDDIRRLLQHLSELRPIGGMGQLVVLSPHEKPGTWTYLVHPAFQGRTIDALAPADRAVVETLLPQPQGFIRANFANNRTATLMGWRQVTRWGWVVFAVGPEPALMATAYRTLMLQAALLLGTGLVIAGLIAWRMRGALRPVGSVAQDLVGLGEGDLSRPPPPARLASRNEVQVLFGAFGRTHAGLLRTVRAVRAGVDEIHGAAGEIAAGNEDLSRRTEAQAASLEQTAASMEQLASTVKQNADNARQASQLAAGAREVARRGGAAVGTVVATMQGISTSSRQIADIVGVIDSIAFQTNILALNAAVEAARAGDQGKGFAVVAGEVRTLAQRSATAAQEIRTLIGEAGGRVEAGVGQVEQAGATMQDIIAAVQRVADILGEITAASQEQASGIDQVNQAVAQMDSVTQQNAALVEQASAAAASLQTQAGHLRETVAAFRLSTAEAGRPAAAGPMTLVLT